MVERHPDIPSPARVGEPIELTIVKGGRTLTYRCDAGREAELIQRLADDAADPEMPLTWFDAAVLSHRVGRSMRDVLNDRSQSPPVSASRRAAGPM
jgi:hypothetical protein